MISVPLVFSDWHPCSYLNNELARLSFVHPKFGMTTATYSELIQQGFRRSGNDVYAPHCMTCTACIPARIRVSDFSSNRTQKRCWQKNSETQVTIRQPHFDQEQYALYLRYQSARHAEGVMSHSSASSYLQFLQSSWCMTSFVEFKIDDELAAVAVVDQLDNALSAVYTFFEPKFSNYSLGVYAVLWQIKWAQSLNKEFLYLGFWIKESKKMSYKSDYQPLQLFRDSYWKAFANLDDE